MTLYAIDPGPHTGIFFFDRNNVPHRVTLDYTDGCIREPHKHLHYWLLQWINPDEDTLVCESFEFRKEDARNREYIDYSTGEFVGVIRLFAQLTGTRIHLQNAATGLTFWDDDKLKRVGLYVEGKENRHVRDATRHWLYFVSFTLNQQTFLRKLK